MVKNLDLFNYWEPISQFRKEKTELRFHYMLQSLAKTAYQCLASSEKIDIPEVSSPVLVGMDTRNQLNALQEFLLLLGNRQHTISFLPSQETQTLSELQLSKLALTHWKQFIRGYLFFDGYDQKIFKQRWPYYFEILGEYEYIRRVMIKNFENLKLYIGANDHSGISQAGFVASRRLGVPSLYIQHASVSEKFPPLKMTHAFLDGQNAKDKYLSVAPTETKIRLVGAMRYDSYLNNPAIDTRPSLVGICFSRVLHDSEQNIKLCEALEKSNQPFEIRFHPAVPQSMRKPFYERGWKESNADEEKALDFILRCGSIVSGDSSILLESIILKRRPIYFASIGEALDYYGFVAKKVVTGPCLKWEEVLDELDRETQIDKLRQNAQHFNHTLGTEWEGKSKHLAAQYLEEII